MHEVSIARSILDIVNDAAEKEGAARVSELVVDVGRLSGVVYDSLNFAMDLIRKDSILESARIVLNDIPGKARCMDCSDEFEVEVVYEECPRCRDFNISIIQGRELKVRSISVEDDNDPAEN